jgi:hypothetical protein
MRARNLRVDLTRNNRFTVDGSRNNRFTLPSTFLDIDIESIQGLNFRHLELTG